MTKINEHGETPPSVKPHRHSSETVRSPNDAGGKLPREQYERPLPERQGGPSNDR
jgi:hypothetical protein